MILCYRLLKCILLVAALKDLIFGLNSLFTDLLNFDDPLNLEAAEQYVRSKRDFQAKVNEYVQHFAR